MNCRRVIRLSGLLVLSVALTALVNAQSPLCFAFGANTPGHTLVAPDTSYTAERGYGFEPSATLTGGKQITSVQPFYFSVAVPEGNYRVTATLDGATTVKAELRRLMVLGEARTAGRWVTRQFIVNVRRPQISTSGAGNLEVKLKDRERTSEWWAWDEKLTLEFNGAHPALRMLAIERADVPTVYLLGDSTVCDQGREPYNSWGQMLTRFFDARIAIANHAESGESLKSSLGTRRLDKVLSLVKPGDYLLLQFGHNDEKEKGGGAFTTYKADLKKYVTAARARGVNVVLLTPMHRRTFDAAGKITNSHGDYPAAVRQVAAEENVPLIDLFALSQILYETLGSDKSGALFKEGDATHHSNYGSYELARCVVAGIKQNKLALQTYLLKNVPAFDPRRPDDSTRLALPPSPLQSNVKPLGN